MVERKAPCREEVTQDDLDCGGYLCDGKQTGNCAAAETLQDQAQNGSDLGENIWPEVCWKDYKKMVEEFLEKGHCSQPDKLQKALDETNPKLI